MKETLKMMKSILNGKESTKDENELIEEYKESLSPNILAYFFVHNFGLISKTGKLYPMLCDEDKASFCLQELDKALHNYKSGNSKFITYFIKCYKRRLWAENQMLLHNNRKSFLNCENLDDINDYYEDEYFSIDEFCKNYNLSSDEKFYCNLYNYGYSTKDIASMVKKSIQCIYKKRKNILQKIENLV